MEKQIEKLHGQRHFDFEFLNVEWFAWIVLATVSARL